MLGDSKMRRFETGTRSLAASPAALFGTLFVAVLAAACGAGGPAPVASGESVALAAADHAEVVARGEYLVTIAGCNDCHTPFAMGPNGPAPDMTRRLSGHPQDLVMPPPPPLAAGPWGWMGAMTNTAFAGPWGVSYAINLTPDENTGIGIWSEEIFVKTLRSGRHWGTSRPILPPMPWENFARLTDEDLSAIYAYLRSIPPIANRVPEAEPADEMLIAAAP